MTLKNLGITDSTFDTIFKRSLLLEHRLDMLFHLLVFALIDKLTVLSVIL